MKTEPAEFVKTAASKKDFIHDGRPCVAFAGKSNVGKSSVINSLLNRKKLARVGSAPGKTTNINYYLVDNSIWFVDLPGYGYAKVSQAEQERWGLLVEDFFASNRIAVGVQIVDGRHKPTELDVLMRGLFRRCGCPMVVAANKWDKLKKSEMEPNLALIRETLDLPEEIRLIAYSAEKGTGKAELLSAISAGV
jgi:ribosome biogenesis GTP-binding protein YsxC/EngB